MKVWPFNKLLIAVATVASVALTGVTATAQAEKFPSKPIRIIVPYGAGGGSDYLARKLSDKLSQRLGQTVIVENRPGADGIIGTNMVARAAPDGYTYLIAVGTHLLN
ncbi:MAG: Bug family tripartite tricarboxylate transporter substrate binding protein, partial [Advenella sp.]